MYELKYIILREISQVEKDEYCMLLLTCEKFFKKSNNKNRGYKSGCQRFEGEG